MCHSFNSGSEVPDAPPPAPDFTDYVLCLKLSPVSSWLCQLPSSKNENVRRKVGVGPTETKTSNSSLTKDEFWESDFEADGLHFLFELSN